MCWKLIDRFYPLNTFDREKCAASLFRPKDGPRGHQSRLSNWPRITTGTQARCPIRHGNMQPTWAVPKCRWFWCPQCTETCAVPQKLPPAPNQAASMHTGRIISFLPQGKADCQTFSFSIITCATLKQLAYHQRYTHPTWGPLQQIKLSTAARRKFAAEMGETSEN